MSEEPHFIFPEKDENIRGYTQCDVDAECYIKAFTSLEADQRAAVLQWESEINTPVNRLCQDDLAIKQSHINAKMLMDDTLSDTESVFVENILSALRGLPSASGGGTVKARHN